MTQQNFDLLHNPNNRIFNNNSRPFLSSSDIRDEKSFLGLDIKKKTRTDIGFSVMRVTLSYLEQTKTKERTKNIFFLNKKNGRLRDVRVTSRSDVCIDGKMEC